MCVESAERAPRTNIVSAEATERHIYTARDISLFLIRVSAARIERVTRARAREFAVRTPVYIIIVNSVGVHSFVFVSSVFAVCAQHNTTVVSQPVLRTLICSDEYERI